MKENRKLALKFLCIGVESSFLAYLLTASESLNLSLDSCRTVEEGLKKISSFTYDVYVIDLSVSQEAVSKLIEAIRKNNEKKSTIALISENHSNEELQVFKTKENIDFILQKPFLSQEVEHFIHDLHQHHLHLIFTSDDKFKALKLEYDEAIHQKIEVLTDLIKSFQMNPDLEHIKELDTAIHKMSSSAAAFGYDSVSLLSKKKDIEIRDRIDSDSFRDPAWMLSFNEYLEKIKIYFQVESIQEFQIPINQDNSSKPVIYVVIEDEIFINLLKHLKERFSIELYCEVDPQMAIDKLNSYDFNPDVVIIAQKFQYSSITYLDLMASQSHKQTSTLYALLLEEENMDVRIEAMQKGIDYIFLKPVSGYYLLKAIKGILEIKVLKTIKALIVDEDIEFCNFMVTTLTEVGITVQTIYDPVNLFQTLENYDPHILFLSTVFPHYDGLNLLKTIRQDVSFKNLIIIIVTNVDEPHTRLKAYSANANDIFYQPIDRKMVQNRVLNLIKTQASMNYLPDPHGYTGFLGYKALINNLHRRLIRSKKYGSYLILFEVHNLMDWIKKKGYGAAKDLLVAISNQVQLEEDMALNCFFFNSKFAILMDDIYLDAVERKIYNFLYQFVQKETQNQISFNCSITPISKDFENAQQIIERGEKSLTEASHIKFAHVKIVDWHSKEEIKNKNAVIIIDPDKELAKVLKQAFESHNIFVKEFTEGEEALNEMLTASENFLPSLIIIERKLPDMDGIDVFRKMDAHFHGKVPFYMLTVFSSDKDVSQGIDLGILEYIVKPFNVSLFMQKALKVIYSASI